MSYESEKKICQNCKGEFTIEPDDFGFYEKIKVPPPTFCFDCRLKRKFAYMNERTLFKRKCDKCSKDMISMFSPQSEHIIFCTSCYNDRGNCLEYGMNYDFSRPFFEQFTELHKKVPKLHLMHKNNNAEKCEYANYTYKSRNVYLSYAVVRSEDIFYCKQVQGENKVCLDSYNIKSSERGYELVDVSRNYNCRFFIRSDHSIDSAYLFGCRECNNCFMSSNLRNKSYVFKNQQLSREKYLETMKKFPLDSYKVQEELKKEFHELIKNSIRPPAFVKSVENVSGDFIGHSKNAHYCFGNVDTESSKYIVFGVNEVRDSYDLVFSGRSELCYDAAGSGTQNNHVIFSVDVGANHDIAYCTSVNNCSDCFGCCGLTNKNYCIFNKQYTKEEYEKLIPKVIEHMNTMPYIDKKKRIYKFGEFFPIEFSAFAYNESLAFEEFLMTKKEVSEEGYQWRDSEEKIYETTIKSAQLPDSIQEVTEGILKEVIACPNKGQVETKCTFAYRIVVDELRFYQLMKIPLPRYCPNCRYYKRRQFINPFKLWHRQCICDKANHPNHLDTRCSNEFETSYAPERPEIVYCEKCYQQEVY